MARSSGLAEGLTASPRSVVHWQEAGSHRVIVFLCRVTVQEVSNEHSVRGNILVAGVAEATDPGWEYAVHDEGRQPRHSSEKGGMLEWPKEFAHRPVVETAGSVSSPLLSGDGLRQPETWPTYSGSLVGWLVTDQKPATPGWHEWGRPTAMNLDSSVERSFSPVRPHGP